MEQLRKLSWDMTLVWWHEWTPSGIILERVTANLLLLEGGAIYSNENLVAFPW